MSVREKFSRLMPHKNYPRLTEVSLLADYSIIIKLSSLLSFHPLSLFCCMLPTFVFLSLLGCNSLNLHLLISFSLFHPLPCSLFSLFCFRDACLNTFHLPYPFIFFNIPFLPLPSSHVQCPLMFFCHHSFLFCFFFLAFPSYFSLHLQASYSLTSIFMSDLVTTVSFFTIEI